MKVQGIVIDGYDRNNAKLLGISLNFNTDDLADEITQTADDKLEDIDKLTKKYMVGSDDAKVFIFSDCTEGINAIKQVYTGFNLQEYESEDFPLDYDYLRDLKKETKS